MSRDLVVSVDCSTSASKAVVWDAAGRLLAEGRAAFALLNPHPSWWEQNAEDWWTATSTALRAAVSQVDATRLAALCMSHQRETFVPVDADGRPLRNAITWADERTCAEVDDIARTFGADRFHQVSGKPLSMSPALPKIVWIGKHEPAVFERAFKYLDVHAFLVHRITGEYRTGWGDADPMGIVDIPRQRWADDLLKAFGLRVDQFPEAFPPGAVMGGVSRQAAARCGLPEGLPVVAAVGDGQSAGLGANITAPGAAYLNLGTAVVVGAFSDRFMADRAFRTMTGALPGTFMLEGVIRGGTFTISWFVERFAGLNGSAPGLNVSAEEILEAAARKVPPGSLGLMLVPYWNNVMNPYWDGRATGITVGWRGVHGKAHLYRAILEGIAFEQRLATDGIEAAIGLPLERFVAMGGGSKSPLLCQIVADVTGKPVTLCASPEATALGAGMLAAVAGGLYSDARTAAAAMAREGDSYTPHPGRRATYERLYTQVYRHIFPALQGLIDRLSELSDEPRC